MTIDRQQYAEIRELALQPRFDDVTAVLRQVYGDEAERLEKIWMDEAMPPCLGFQYQQAIRRFRSLERKLASIQELHFEDQPEDYGNETLPLPFPA